MSKYGLTYERLQQVTGDEYYNLKSIVTHLDALTQAERLTVASSLYSNAAYLATVQWADWHSSNAYGGPRKGKNRAALLAELEAVRVQYQTTFGVTLTPIKAACTRAYYDSFYS